MTLMASLQFPLLFILATFLGLSASFADPQEVLYGDIFDRQGQKKHFQFTHKINVKDNKRQSKVVYKDTRGKIVLEEEIETLQGQLNSYKIKQHQINRRARIFLKDKQVHFQLLDLKTGKLIEETQKEVPDSKVVVGSTVFQLIEANDQKLIDDKDVEFHIALWGRQDLIEFYLRKERMKSSVLTLHMLPSNFFVRQFVETIVIDYDTHDKQILSYKGRTNLMEKVEGEWESFDGIIKINHSQKSPQLTSD